MRLKKTNYSVVIIALLGLSIVFQAVAPVKAVQWSSPTQVPANTTFNEKPSPALDNQSNIWLVYESAIVKQSYFKIYNGFSWTSEQNATSTKGFNERPDIDTLSNGTIFLTWSTNRTGYVTLFYKTNTRLIWSPDKQLTPNNILWSPTTVGNGDDAPSVTQDLKGNIWVFWQRVVGGSSNVFYKVYTPGSGWGGEAQLTHDTADIYPSATVTSDGRVWVAFSVLISGNYNLWYMYFNGVGWSSELRLTSYSLNDQNPALVQTRDNTVWVVWVREIKVATGVYGTDLYYENSTNLGGSWSAATPITTTGSSATSCGFTPCSNFDPSLLQSTDKRLYLFWSTDWSPTNPGANFNIYYQFTPPILIHDLAVTAISASPQKLYSGGLKSIGQGPLVSVNVTVTNLGDYSETAQFSLYSNSTVLNSQSFVLAIGQSQVVRSLWNTTGVAAGCYLIKGTVATVPGELESANNVLVWGMVHVLPLGDVDQDGNINFTDASIVAFAYGSTPGMSNWNPYADIDGNGVVDFSDFSVMAFHYGTASPLC